MTTLLVLLNQEEEARGGSRVGVAAGSHGV